LICVNPWLEKKEILFRGKFIRAIARRLIGLHDFAHEDVKLAVGLFTHFGDFVRTRFVAGDGGAATRR